MEDIKTEDTELRSIIRGVIEEFVQAEQVKAEPAHKAELMDERRRREELERRVNDLIHENKRSRQLLGRLDRGVDALDREVEAVDRVGSVTGEILDRAAGESCLAGAGDQPRRLLRFVRTAIL